MCIYIYTYKIIQEYINITPNNVIRQVADNGLIFIPSKWPSFKGARESVMMTGWNGIHNGVKLNEMTVC